MIQDWLCRTCQLIAAIVSAASSGIQLLLGCNLLGKIKIPLEDYICNAMASCPQQASEWDDAEDACDSYPSLPAVEAVLDALEVGRPPMELLKLCGPQVCHLDVCLC